MSKDDTKKPAEHHHQGSVAAEDEALSLWLGQQWVRESPERIELWQMFGRKRGEMIHHEDFKLGEKLDVEQANKLANDLLASAQNDCDSATKESKYQLAIIDRNRKSQPLVRGIGPLQPKRAYAITKAGADDDDEDALDAKSIALKYAQIGITQTQWATNRNDRVVEGMLVLQHNIIKNQQEVLNNMFAQQVTMFKELQSAKNEELDRELIREREKFKRTLWEDGLRTVRNILPGFMNNGASNGTAPNPPPSNGNGNGHSTAPVKDYGASPERALVDNFLYDCEKTKIDISLFGDWDDQDGKLVQIKPGIFSAEQFYILVGVRNGRFPAEALDELMPDSGQKNAITEEQVKKAGEAGVTEGIGMAIIQLVALRKRAKEEAAAAANGTIHETQKETEQWPST
jgi:hypothetical protein